MDDQVLTYLAIFFEVLVPVILIFFARKMYWFKKVGISYIGAISPLFFMYCYISVSYLIFDSNELMYTFYVMWVMSFIAYCISGLAGVAIGSVISFESSAHKKYISGLAGGLALGVFLFCSIVIK